MAEAAQLTRDDVVVSWLPLYHDMGLIGCASPRPGAARRSTCCRPISRTRASGSSWSRRVSATFTVSPDFGYRNCVRNIARHERARSLVSLKQALSGAEPVRLSTIEAFEEKFGVAEPHHALLRPRRGHPGRGDLAAQDTAPPRQLGPVPLGGPALPRRVACASWTARRTVDAGRGGRDLREEPRRHAGLLQQSRGDPAACSRPTAGCAPATSASSTREGYLYVTGRLKDLIILGGENVVPADIEEIVDHVPGVRYSAAVGHRERAHRHPAPARGGRGARAGRRRRRRMSRLVREIVQRVHQGRGHRPARVLLVRPGTIPKTSSGKIQRSRLGEMIASDELRRPHRLRLRRPRD